MAQDTIILSDGVAVGLQEATSQSSVASSNILSSIREMLDDTGEFYTDQDINDAIQDGYDEVVAFSGCITKGATLALEANKTYYDLVTAIPDFLALIGIWNSSYKRWLSPVSYRELDSMRWDWECANANPYAFCPISYRKLAIFPTPTVVGTTLYVYYKATAGAIAGGFELPAELLGDVVEDYAVCDLFEQQEEWTKAQINFRNYQDKTVLLRRFLDKRDNERLSRAGGN